MNKRFLFVLVTYLLVCAPQTYQHGARLHPPMLSKLAKHVAVISGGGSGLGRATAEHLVKSGARVVLLDLPSSDGAVVAERLGENATFCPTDVTSEEQVSAALDLAESLYGEPVSSAISCAGILHAAKTVSRKGVAYPLDAFSRVLHVNVVGTFNVSRLAAHRMVACGAWDALLGWNIPQSTHAILMAILLNHLLISFLLTRWSQR